MKRLVATGLAAVLAANVGCNSTTTTGMHLLPGAAAHLTVDDQSRGSLDLTNHGPGTIEVLLFGRSRADALQVLASEETLRERGPGLARLTARTVGGEPAAVTLTLRNFRSHDLTLVPPDAQR